MTGKPGRPTKLTPLLQAQIIELIEQGNYVEVAAVAVGVTDRTYYNWIERGRRAEETQDEDDQLYAEFFLAAKEAEARAEAALLVESRVRDKNWQASMTIMERRFRKRWSLTQRHEVTGKDGEPLSVEQRLDPATTKSVHELLAKISALPD